MRVFVEDGRHPDRVTHAVGYAELHRQIILGLDRLGEEVGLPDCHAQLENGATLPAPVRDRLLQLSRRPCRDDLHTVYLHVATPDHFNLRAGRFNAAFTMTERESLAHYQGQFDWVGICNAADLIVTPTEWNKTVFERHGIRNVVVCPLGVDAEFFTPAPVRFLSILRGYGRRGSRANWADIVEAFRSEFRSDESVTLTILSQEIRPPFRYGGWRDALHNLPRDVVERIRGANGSPRIFVREGGTLAPEQLRECYRAHDCYVSYSREGWGFPLLEAMACSLDVIASDYGAPMAYLRGSPARLFAAGKLSADNLQFEGGDLAALRRHMRNVFEERRAMRSWARRFGWDAAVRALRDVLRSTHAEWLARRA